MSDPATTTREGMVQLERALPVDLWRRICDALGVRCGAETFNETEGNGAALARSNNADGRLGSAA